MSVGWKKFSKFKRKEPHKSETASNEAPQPVRISMQASLFSYFRCAPRLLTLLLLSHSGAPSLNHDVGIAGFLLTFGTSSHRYFSSDSLRQVGFRDSAAPPGNEFSQLFRCSVPNFCFNYSWLPVAFSLTQSLYVGSARSAAI